VITLPKAVRHFFAPRARTTTGALRTRLLVDVAASRTQRGDVAAALSEFADAYARLLVESPDVRPVDTGFVIDIVVSLDDIQRVDAIAGDLRRCLRRRGIECARSSS
jgi:hypothetical protein